VLYNKRLPIEQSALLVIDAQDSFKAMPRWEPRNNRDFEANVARLIAAYRGAGLPVIYFLHTDDDPGMLRDFRPGGCGSGLCGRFRD